MTDRVLSVGIGTFLIFAFAILWIILAVLGKILRQAVLYVVGGVLMVIIILVLVLSPRSAPGQSGIVIPANATPIYSSYSLGLILFATMMGLAAIGSCVGVGLFTLPVSRHVRSVD